MRIVFMGTPDFAVPCLQRILADGHEVPAVSRISRWAATPSLPRRR